MLEARRVSLWRNRYEIIADGQPLAMTDEAGMIVATDRVGRKRWTDELRGPLQGSVGLPARLFWSGPSPYEVRWDLADPIPRRDSTRSCSWRARWMTSVN